MKTQVETPPRGRKPRLWDAFKKQSIQEAVIQLMCRDGLASVTMERVAEEAGIAKGTVYLHYRDKQALLDSVKDASLSPLMVKLDEVFDSDLEPEAKLRAFAARYLAYFDERKDLFRILLYEREVRGPQGSRYRADRYRRMVEGTAQAVRDGIAAGAFRPLDAEGVGTMFVESNIGIMNHRLLQIDRAPVEADAELISDLFLAGLRAEKHGAANRRQSR